MASEWPRTMRGAVRHLQIDTDPRRSPSACSQALQKKSLSSAAARARRRPAEPIVTTAAYDPNSKKCYVYGKERATVDVCRSIAHEMTHMMQDFNGDLVGLIKDVGGFHEDQANAKAGEIIKRFAYSNDDRMKIYESYSRFILK